MDAVVVIGGGPAGLAAAERLAGSGVAVEVMDAMPTVGRKFLLAGKSGLNLTHAEPFEFFLTRYGSASGPLSDALKSFSPERLRVWARELGSETFVGSSGRIFPLHMKASPLLRSWLRRLSGAGVTFRTRWRWTGFGTDGALLFTTPDGPMERRPPAVVFAMGGASWPRLGSDAAWTEPFSAAGIPVAPFRPANCGFDVAWSDVLRQRHAGAPVKSVTARLPGGEPLAGEFVVTASGIEGSLVYALSAALRDRLESTGSAHLLLDLLPGRDAARIARDLARQPARQSFSNRLRKATGLEGVKAALVRECAPDAPDLSADDLARRMKDLQLRVSSCRPIEEAISSAGGVSLSALDPGFMVRSKPGLFVCGEMLDWEAPTGGYLLTACFATGRAAAEGVLAFLARRIS